MDAQNIELGYYPYAAGAAGLQPSAYNDFRAYLYLPPGTAVANTVIVGHPGVSGYGLTTQAQETTCMAVLKLYGTTFTVNTALTVGPLGTVDAYIQGTPSGVDLADAATLAVTGKLNLIFEESDPNPEEFYWGLRWAGNHMGDLLTLKNSGLLTWDDTAIGGGVNIVYVAADDATYVAVAEAPANLPPVARAKDFTIGIEPALGETTAVVLVSDVDDGSFDPEGFVADIRISSLDDTEDPDDPHTVTFTMEGDYIVTLTIQDDIGQTASAECTVFVISPIPTPDSLTWSGGAGLDKTEWGRGANWVGLNPPDNPTPGTLTFADLGVAINTVNADWTVGGMVVSNTAGTHFTDLAAHSLVIVGNMIVGQNPLSGTSRATIDNGNLQIGTPEATVNLVVGRASNRSATGYLTLSDTALTPHLATISIGQGDYWSFRGTGVVDLTAATVVGGQLAANIVNIGFENGNGTLNVSEASGLTGLTVRQTLNIGSRGIGKVGDSGNSYKLPAGVSITLGQWGTTRCNVALGREASNADWVADGRLIASSGGTCTAYIGTLILGYHRGGSEDWAANGSGTGILDLGMMDSVTMDATSILLSSGDPVSSPGHNDGRATLALPPGTATAVDVVVANAGVDTTNSDPTCGAVLTLNGTTFSVTNSLVLGPKGTVNTNVKGASCGLDLPDAAVTLLGAINIVFEQDPVGSGIHSGLCWEGEHAADLQALVDAGLLTWDDTALSTPAGIFESGGFTYVGAAVNMASISEFTVADATSGSALVTNAATVNVAIVAQPSEGAVIDGYVINESGSEPTEGWQASLTTYEIQAASGSTITLYAWAKDSAGNVAGAQSTNYYNTAAPVVLASSITDNADRTATVEWTTDIMAEGSVKYGPVALAGATPNEVKENALGTSHSAVLTGIVAGTNYKIVLVNTEVASAAVYWPLAWPIEGDANMDCRVNILDLIFIRNKLNQPVGTGDNWKADVNGDGRINILDLIFVRNKLNTQCP